MKRTLLGGAAALIALSGLGMAWRSGAPASAGTPSAILTAGRSAGDDLGDPDLKKKLVPIITFGSSLNIGVAQVAGEERDVDRCKAVAQLETDYKDRARIKILVPVQSENVVSHIDRVPGVSVTAIGDYAIKK